MTQPNKPETTSSPNGEKTDTPTKSLSISNNALRETLEYCEEQAGGRTPFVQALASSKNPAAKALVKALGKTENDDKTIYDVALAIKKDPMELQKAFAEGLQVHQIVETANKMFKSLPDVMGAAVKSAKVATKEGHADRKMLFQIAGLFPKEGGLQISFNQNFGAMLPTDNPAKGTHDLLHTNPYDDVIDVEPEDDDAD